MVDGFASSFLNISLKKSKKGDKRPKDGAEASDQPSKKLQTSPLPPPPSEAQLISPFQSLHDPSIRFLPLPEGPVIDLAERVGRTALDGLSHIASAPQSYPIALPFPSLPFSEFATELERSLAYVSALASEARKMAEDDQASSASRIAKLEADLTATASEKARLEEDLRAQREEAVKARGELKIAEEALALRGRELERKDKDLVEKGKALEVCQADLDWIAYFVLYQMYASVQRQFNAEADLSFLEDPEKIKDALTYCRDKWAKELAVERASPSASQATSIQQREEDARSKGTEVTSTLPAHLGETIYTMKEDFIMVHLQHSCTHCRLLMVSGTRWVCNKCKYFQLCEKCYDTEQRLDARERHPINSRDKHDLFQVEITDVSPDTKDKDEILESEFFDTRRASLSLCQAGQGWHCEKCPEFDVCYKKDGGIDPPHPLTNYPTTSELDAQNQEARERVVQQRKTLELLVHTSQCQSRSCQYPNCRNVRGLFQHGINCKIQASGGCLLCKKMWYLLQLHARACKESECHVPRCKDLKDHLRSHLRRQ